MQVSENVPRRSFLQITVFISEHHSVFLQIPLQTANSRLWGEAFTHQSKCHFICFDLKVFKNKRLQNTEGLAKDCSAESADEAFTLTDKQNQSTSEGSLLRLLALFVCFFTPRSVAHLESGRLGLSLQDVTLQILRGAQRSHAWTAARTVQPALLCELHHIVLLGQMSQRLRQAVPHMCLFMLNCQWTTQKCCWSPSKQAESDFRGNDTNTRLIVHGHVDVHVISRRSEKRTALQLQLLQTSCCFWVAAHEHRKTNKQSYLRFIYIVSKWSSQD